MKKDGNNIENKINVVINNKELMNKRMQDATYFHSEKLWDTQADFYYSGHAWKNAQNRWNCTTRELFIQECVEILNDNNIDDALMGVAYGQPVALLDDETGRVLWFRHQLYPKGNRFEFFIHSVFLRDYNQYDYIYIQDKSTYCLKVLKDKTVIVGIENIPEFKLNKKGTTHYNLDEGRYNR